MEQKDNGYLEIILGPMFSGKTSRLIEIYKQYKNGNNNVLVVNHLHDNRYDDSFMTTHNGSKIECEKWMNLSDFIEYHSVMLMDIEKPLVILINEGQFFSDLYSCVKRLVTVYKCQVFVCGLDGDFKREQFGYILDLIPLCDKVYKLTSLCVRCNNETRAIFSHRITKEEKQTVIGSSETYIPICRKCYEDIHK